MIADHAASGLPVAQAKGRICRPVVRSVEKGQKGRHFPTKLKRKLMEIAALFFSVSPLHPLDGSKLFNFFGWDVRPIYQHQSPVKMVLHGYKLQPSRPAGLLAACIHPKLNMSILQK